MSKPELILIGAGGHTHACIDVIEQHGQYQIAGLVGLPEELNNRHLGWAQLKQLPAMLASKRGLFHRYKTAFDSVAGLKLMPEPEQCQSNYWLQTL